MSYHHFVSKKLICFTAICVFCTLIPFPYLVAHFSRNPFFFPEYLQRPLLEAFGNGIWLAVLTSCFALLWSVPAAILLGLYQVPYKKIWIILLILPMAIPSYLSAFAYSDLLYYTGGLAKYYQSITGTLLPFNIRSTVGGAWVLSLSLYPYIFFPLYLRISRFDQNILDYAQTIGHEKSTIIYRLILKSSISIILFGLTLVILEALGDYGTVSHFGIESPSLFLFDVWQQTGDIAISVNITMIYLLLTGIIFAISYILQISKNYASNRTHKPLKPFQFKNNINLWTGCLWFCIIFSAAFAVPSFFYVSHFINHIFDNIFALQGLVYDSFVPTILAAILCVVMGLIFGFFNHFGHYRFIKLLIIFATSGYAMPGVILAIAVYIALIYFNRMINFYFDVSWIFVSGTIWGLVISYYIKFLTVSYGVISPIFKTLNISVYSNALLCGYGRLRGFMTVYGPIFSRPMVIAFVMVMVDILKELPITLLMRPMGFETFATFTFNMAGLEQIEYAAGAALVLILISSITALIPIMLHFKKQD